jgi:hypothetical protein
MGLIRWAGALDVGVCDVQWASDGLQGFKSETVDPSKVSRTPLTAQASCRLGTPACSIVSRWRKHSTSCATEVASSVQLIPVA